MVVYTFEQRWGILRRYFKNHDNVAECFRWRSFWSWRVCKQAKLSHLGHRKPACIHWKADALKSSLCLVRILAQRHNFAIFLRKWAERGRYNQWRSLSGHVERIFVFWQHLIELSAAELMSIDHLGAAIWQRLTIICEASSKINVTPTSQSKLTL